MNYFSWKHLIWPPCWKLSKWIVHIHRAQILSNLHESCLISSSKLQTKLNKCVKRCVTILKLKKLFDTFVQLVLKIISGQFHEDLTEFVSFWNVLFILTTFNMFSCEVIQLSTWRPNSDFSKGNNWLTLWVGQTVSPDIDSKFEIYSCDERGVKTHLH